MRYLSAAVFAAWGVLAVLAVPTGAQSPGLVDASVVCSARHQFGAKPVDVAKTADGATVLATTSWNWHDAIGCYLTLDDQATAALRAADPPSSLPAGVSAASQLCSDHHQFGREPVDVAKTADGNTVLARLVWNWHDQIGCYLTLDPEAVGALQAAHTAANAPDPTPDPTPDPDDNGDPPPRPAVSIAVPASEPSGRCASAIPSGVYQWEQCAWAKYWEDTDHNWSLSDSEAAALIARIWAEVDVDGKPVSPPTSALIPAGSQCTEWTESGYVIGCYQPSLHHIRRLDAFLETLLHETAHALVANHPSIQRCRSITDNDEYQACAHNDIFRCVANHFYVAYAGIPDAGVCGTASDGGTTGSTPSQWTSSADDGAHLAWVNSDWHTRPAPFEDSTVSLVVLCRDGDLNVYLWFDEGRIDGDANGTIPFVHVFIPEGFSEWGSERQREYIADHRVDARWHESTTNQSVFLPENLLNGFLGDMASHNAVLIQAWNADNTVFGLMSFPLEGASAHIGPVEDQCEGSDGRPAQSKPADGCDWGLCFRGADWDSPEGSMSLSFHETDYRGNIVSYYPSMTVLCSKKNADLFAGMNFSGVYIYATDNYVFGSVMYEDTSYAIGEWWLGTSTNQVLWPDRPADLRSLLLAIAAGPPATASDYTFLAFGITDDAGTRSGGVASLPARPSATVAWFLNNCPY